MKTTWTSATLRLMILLSLTTCYTISIYTQPITIIQHKKISAATAELESVLSQNDAFGGCICSIGDLDQDGYPDMAISAFHDHDNGFQRGALYILFLEEDGTTIKDHQKIDETNGDFPYSLLNDAIFGVGCTSIGDLDQDGIPDIAVGAAYADEGGDNVGQIYILFMNTDGTVKDAQKIGAGTGGLDASLLTIWSAFGRRIANMGDMDGDGITDIAVGGYTDREGGEQHKGAIWILFLNADGTAKDVQKINDYHGNFPYQLNSHDHFGMDLINIGDRNADGINDLIVAARLDDDAGSDKGALYLIFLNPDGTVLDADKFIPGAGGLADIQNLDKGFGTALAALDDVNGDGITDIAVGSFHDDDGAPNAGAIWIVPLDESGAPLSTHKISGESFNFSGQLDEEDNFGFSIGGASLSSPTTMWLGVGAPNDDDEFSNSGAVYLLQLRVVNTSSSTDDVTEPTSLHLFPNPSSSSFNIEWNDSFKGNTQINIYSADGKIVYQKDALKTTVNFSHTINFQSQPTGIYFLQINTANKVVTQRFAHISKLNTP